MGIETQSFEPRPPAGRFVCVVDDDIEIQQWLDQFLPQIGYDVRSFTTPLTALTFLRDDAERIHCDAVLCDLKMPEMDGLAFIDEVRSHSQIPIILMTAFSSLESAIDSIKRGAFDYVAKPLNISDLKVRLSRAIQFSDLQTANASLRKEISRTWRLGDIIGKSTAMQALFSVLPKVAASSSSVLIHGESGTGKELFARAIHNHSPRADKPFVPINCSAIPEALLESELFGHAKGAFTGALNKRLGLFEEAKGGTIFLDEIGDMAPALQAKLLRVLQDKSIRPVGENAVRQIDVRIVAATHVDLKSATKNGGFREDLFYRLSVIPIRIPPLRERVDDIALLSDYFLKKHSVGASRETKRFSRNAMAKLLGARWEGNVRELENVIERAVVLSNGHIIEEGELATSEPAQSPDNPGHPAFTDLFSQLLPLAELERKYIEYVLHHTENHKSKAALVLGINRATLRRKQIELGENGSEATSN